MFTAKNIIDYTTEEDRKKLENRNKYSELYKVLSFFDRVRLSRIDRMIEKITRAIKKRIILGLFA